MLQIVAMDVVSTWLYPDQELSIIKVSLEDEGRAGSHVTPLS